MNYLLPLAACRDQVDPAALQQNVAAWTAMLAIVAHAPEELATRIPIAGG